MASEYANKGAFSDGFRSSFNDKSVFVCGTESGHWVPEFVRDGSNNRCTGDACFMVRKRPDSDPALLIVELECSPPGNETNILKWFEAVRHGRDIFLHKRKAAIRQCARPIEIDLVLAFVEAGKSFNSNTLNRAMQMCGIVGEVIQAAPPPSGIQFRIHTFVYPGKCPTHRDAAQWEACGMAVGRWFAMTG